MPGRYAHKLNNASTRPQGGELGPDIFRAAQNNDTEELGRSLRAGQRLDKAGNNSFGMTPAHVACMSKSTEFMLVACKHHSFDPWIRDRYGRLPFDHASARGDKVTMSALLALMYPSDSPSPSI